MKALLLLLIAAFSSPSVLGWGANIILTAHDPAEMVVTETVYRGTVTGGPYPDLVATIPESAGMSVIDSGLAPGSGPYYYCARATNSLGTEGPCGNEGIAVEPATTVPSGTQIIVIPIP